MSAYATGHRAEERAARYLTRLGFDVIQLNWRTKFCEIDIVAKRGDSVYFIEVKYRSSSRWGMPEEYVTARKLAQMRFAAHLWLARHNWPGSAQLAVIGIIGSTFRLEALEI